MELKIKSKGLFLCAVLILCTGTLLFSYGSSVSTAPLLKELGGYEFYALVAALGSSGMMMCLPAVGALSAKLGNKVIMLLGVIIMFVSRVAILFVNNYFLLAFLLMAGSFGSGMVLTAPYVLIGTV